MRVMVCFSCGPRRRNRQGIQRVRHEDAKLFQVEQKLLAFEAAGVAHESPVGADDPVTRHDHGNGIPRVGHADVAGKRGIAQLRGKLPV